MGQRAILTCSSDFSGNVISSIEWLNTVEDILMFNPTTDSLNDTTYICRVNHTNTTVYMQSIVLSVQGELLHGIENGGRSGRNVQLLSSFFSSSSKLHFGSDISLWFHCCWRDLFTHLLSHKKCRWSHRQLICPVDGTRWQHSGINPIEQSDIIQHANYSIPHYFFWRHIYMPRNPSLTSSCWEHHCQQITSSHC